GDDEEAAGTDSGALDGDEHGVLRGTRDGWRGERGRRPRERRRLVGEMARGERRDEEAGLGDRPGELEVHRVGCLPVAAILEPVLLEQLDHPPGRLTLALTLRVLRCVDVDRESPRMI